MATVFWLAAGILTVATAAFVIYLLARNRKADHTHPDNKTIKNGRGDKSRNKAGEKMEDLRISPKVFSVGPIITSGPYRSSNLCNDTKLFPMKDIYVNYGREGKIPDGARCTEYIQPP